MTYLGWLNGKGRTGLEHLPGTQKRRDLLSLLLFALSQEGHSTPLSFIIFLSMSRI